MSTTISQPLICCLHYVHQYILVYILYIILGEKGVPNGGYHHITHIPKLIYMCIYFIECNECDHKSHDIKIIIGTNTDYYTIVNGTTKKHRTLVSTGNNAVYLQYS